MLYSELMKATIFLSAAIAALTAAAEWKISSAADEITDEVYYLIDTDGTSVETHPGVNYTPSLCFKVRPQGLNADGKMLHKTDALIIIDEGLHRGSTEIITRFDRAKPTTHSWPTSTSRRAAFAPNGFAFMRSVAAATNLTVRFTTTLGHVRTIKFSVADFKAAMNEVVARYKKTAEKIPAAQ